MGKFKKIVLTNFHFRIHFLKIGSIYYRASNKKENKFQSDNPNQGRFNKNKKSALYIGSSPEACIYEKLSQDETVKKVFIIKYELKKQLMVLDLSRWSYTEDLNKNRILWNMLMKMVSNNIVNRNSLMKLSKYGNRKCDYSKESILINQHVTCPNLGCKTPWLYDITNIIAEFARENKFDGILYQSAVAHNMEGPNVLFEHDPNNLINYVLFQNSTESKNYFKVVSNEERKITNSEGDSAKKILNCETIIRKIKCRNTCETVAGVALDNKDYEPSLEILEIEK